MPHNRFCWVCHDLAKIDELSSLRFRLQEEYCVNGLPWSMLASTGTETEEIRKWLADAHFNPTKMSASNTKWSHHIFIYLRVPWLMSPISEGAHFIISYYRYEHTEVESKLICCILLLNY